MPGVFFTCSIEDVFAAAEAEPNLPKFSKEERDFLENHISFCLSLEQNRRPITTENQKRFVLMCSGRLNKLEYIQEKAYAKYMKIRAFLERQKAESQEKPLMPLCEEGDPTPGWTGIRGKYDDIPTSYLDEDDF